VLFCWLLKANIVATLSIANLDAARTLALKDAIHIWMQRCFPVAVIIAAIVVAIDLLRIVRVNRKDRFVLTTGVSALMGVLLVTAVFERPAVAGRFPRHRSNARSASPNLLPRSIVANSSQEYMHANYDCQSNQREQA
jgi:hypothetical protein